MSKSSSSVPNRQLQCSVLPPLFSPTVASSWCPGFFQLHSTLSCDHTPWFQQYLLVFLQTYGFHSPFPPYFFLYLPEPCPAFFNSFISLWRSWMMRSISSSTVSDVVSLTVCDCWGRGGRCLCLRSHLSCMTRQCLQDVVLHVLYLQQYLGSQDICMLVCRRPYRHPSDCP